VDRVVNLLFRRSRIILAGWVLVSLVGAAFALGLEGRVVPGGEASPSSQANAVARELGHNDVPSLFLVVSGPAVENPAELIALRAKVASVPGVRAVTPLPLPPAAPDVGPMTVLGVVPVGGIDGSIGVARRLLAQVDRLAPHGSAVFLGGYGAHREELVELSQSDLLRAEKAGVPIVLVVLLLTFGSFWASLLPLAIGLAALLGGLGAAGALAFGVDFSEYVTNAASMVGLALAIDYAMFLVQRVREAMLTGLEVDAAIRVAMRTTGVAIAWSGLTVMVAEATMFLIDARAIQTAGLGMMLVTAAAVVAALVGAPIVLRLLGPRILRTVDQEQWKRRTGRRVAGAHRAQPRPAHTATRDVTRFWQRWGVRVTRHPAGWLALGAVVLAVLCIPALHLASKVDLPSADALPASSQVRQATDVGARAFGPGVLSPVELVVHGTAHDAERVAQEVRSSPELRSMQVLPLREAYRVSIATAHAPADPRTESFVRNLRDGPLRSAITNVTYEVGGESALRLDATGALFSGLPVMLAALLALVVVVFSIAMRSIVLPLKGIALVMLTLGATAGVLVLLSTTGPGARLIGWSHPQELHPIVPITIVAIVIALSTDYEVILISRIGEKWRTTRDNTDSIVDGVAHTGRVISSAAAIMIAVFFGFTLSDVTPLRQLGVGLAFAVFIDATVARGVLVPSSMQLLGRLNWWFPRLSRSVPPVKGPIPCAIHLPALPGPCRSCSPSERLPA
jgi:uncharacterized membrane protein YdfJ with MMPL/SSD domain